MATVTRTFTPLLGKRLRVTSLDNCGRIPVAGTPDSVVVTDGFVSVGLSAEVEEGTEIIVRRADGSLCVNERLASSFKSFTVEAEFCGVDPGLLSLTTNAELYENYQAVAAGIVIPEGKIDKRFALELWTGLSGAACAPGVEEASGYMLLPYVQAGVISGLTVDGENAVSFSLTNSYTRGGNTWDVGPYKVLATGGAAAEVQRLTITGTPTGGTFALTLNGQTTAAIPYNATAAAVQTALLALTNLDTGDVVVTGGPGPGTPYVFTFGGSYAGENVPEMTVAASLTGGTAPAAAISTTTQGATGASGVLPTGLDPLDHFLLIETGVAPPAVGVGLLDMPAA